MFLCDIGQHFFIISSFNQIPMNVGIVAAWLQEINATIEVTVHGNCSFSHQPKFAPMVEGSEAMSFSTHFPHDSEIFSYHRQFSSSKMSTFRANNKLLPILFNSKYNNWVSLSKDLNLSPHDHFGQHVQKCVQYTNLLAKNETLTPKHTLSEYLPLETTRPNYLMQAHDAMIDTWGSVMLECGHISECYHGHFVAWKSRPWYKRCQSFFQSTNKSFSQFLDIMGSTQQAELLMHCNTFNKTIPKYDSVMVIAAQYDGNFHHNMADSLSRLVRYLPFLRQNPHIKVHTRSWEKTDKRIPVFMKYLQRKSRIELLKILGIAPTRLVEDIVIGNHVYFPSCMSWAFSLRNPFEVRLLAKELLVRSKRIVEERVRHPLQTSFPHFNASLLFPKAKLKVPPLNHQVDNPGSFNRSKRNLVLLNRNGMVSWGIREWAPSVVAAFVEQLSLAFPTHNILMHNSEVLYHPGFCMACEIEEMSRADIFVGIHGAGLTKEMFMPPNSVIFEISTELDISQMPLCGYYSNWATVFGHHHFLYAYDANNNPASHEEFDVVDATKELVSFYHSTRR